METRIQKHKDTNDKEKVVKSDIKGIPDRKKGKVDFILLGIVIIIALFGMYMVLSTTYYNNLVNGVSPYKTFLKHCVFFVAGLVIMGLFIIMDDYTWLMSHQWVIWGLSLAMLAAVLIFGRTTNGAGRWISLFGMTIQPSEFAKYMVVIVLAAYIHKNPYISAGDGKRKAVSGWRQYLLMLIIIVLPAGLIVLEKALSMTAVLVLTCMIMMILSGIDMMKVGITALGALAGIVVFVVKEPWRLTRIIEFLRWKFGMPVDLSENILQSVQSTYAFGAGGLTGRGMVESRQKFKFLPMSESDFILSIIGEEFGFIWIVVLVILYALLMIRGVHIAAHARCRFGGYLALGITLIFTLQTLVNMFVATTLFPVTGQALPLISQGGSSLISHMGAMGLLLNISRETT